MSIILSLTWGINEPYVVIALLIYHRAALSDIFEVIDLDGNGLLSLEEYNLFEERTSGEKCDEDAWAVCKGECSLRGGDEKVKLLSQK